QRLGWTEHATPDKIELDLMQLAPRRHWDILSHTLIFHGRRVCTALRPACVSCAVNKRCPSAFAAEQVGRKPPRLRATGPLAAKPSTEPKKRRANPAKKPAAITDRTAPKAAKRLQRKPKRAPR
ncbi:MAG TPA: hypothetical protein VFU02_05085, partial [Polyangiaceae bacterium]|nr:hypothetical protein [Polyangiaceae bacterium]